MRHVCFARNIKINKTTGVSPHYKRFGREFKGPRIPFGAEVMYKPSPIYEKKWTADGKGKWSNVRHGIFLGYKVLSGGDGEMPYLSRTLRTSPYRTYHIMRDPP